MTMRTGLREVLECFTQKRLRRGVPMGTAIPADQEGLECPVFCSGISNLSEVLPFSVSAEKYTFLQHARLGFLRPVYHRISALSTVFSNFTGCLQLCFQERRIVYFSKGRFWEHLKALKQVGGIAFCTLNLGRLIRAEAVQRSFTPCNSLKGEKAIWVCFPTPGKQAHIPAFRCLSASVVTL